MKKINNKFGEGVIFEKEDLGEKIYATSAACMSVWSDMLSFANKYPDRFVNDPREADSIVVLSCQVTDLAVLNDIKVAAKLHELTGKHIYIGGCLAQRMDILLPEFTKRLDVVREIGVELNDTSLVHYEIPFWVPDFKEEDESLKEGHLFRDYYPLKLGAGCHGNCKYCTIRHTRGETYETVAKDQIEEFLNHEHVVLTSDSPSVKQIKEWASIAKEMNKEISIRNVEPQNIIQCEEELLDLARCGLLDIVHCPVQSFDKNILESMNRSVDATYKAIDLLLKLRNLGVITATNIIIDYVVDGVVLENHDREMLDEYFDYYSWNPYFDGNFDLARAEKRFNKYILGKQL